MPRSEKLYKVVEAVNASEHQIFDGARDGLMAIIFLSLEMDHRFGDLTMNPLPGFSKDQVMMCGYSDAVRALISECRGILKKSRKKSPS